MNHNVLLIIVFVVYLCVEGNGDTKSGNVIELYLQKFCIITFTLEYCIQNALRIY